MPNRDFEVSQLMKAFRSGLISEALFEQQMDELVAASNAVQVPNVFAYRGDGKKVTQKDLSRTALSESSVFTLPAGYQPSGENSHKGDQLVYVIEGKATCRVSGNECEIKAGDFITIPAGAPHSLRTGSEPLFAVTVIAPPEGH